MSMPVDTYAIIAGLRALSLTQEHLDNRSDASSKIPMGERATKEQVREYFFAMIAELTELADEVGWKSWKETGFDRRLVAAEMADVLAFLGIIVNILRSFGMTPEEMAGAYKDKTRINEDRFAGRVGGGYGRG